MTIDTIESLDVFFNIKQDDDTVTGHLVLLTKDQQQILKTVISGFNHKSNQIKVAQEPTYTVKDKCDEVSI